MVNDPSSLPDLPALLSRLREWSRVGAIADIDRHLAEFVARHQEGGGGVESVLSACVLSWMGARGHTCLCIEALAGKAFPSEGPIVDHGFANGREWVPSQILIVIWPNSSLVIRKEEGGWSRCFLLVF